MTDIEFGKFTIPQIPTNNSFKGSFSIENDVILIFLEYDAKDDYFKDLFILVDKREFFSVIIDYKHSSIGCYECRFLSRLSTVLEYGSDGSSSKTRKPRYESGYIKAVCSCWTDEIATEDLDTPFFNSFYLKYRYSDAWFSSTIKDNDIYLKDGTLISFICGEDTLIQRKPYKIEKKQSGKVYVKRTEAFSLREVIDIAFSVQVFLRIVTDSPIPPGSIQFEDKDEPYIRYDFHGETGIIGTREESSVINLDEFLISLQTVISTPGLLQNWFENWKEYKQSLVRFVECQNPKRKEELIVNLVKSFDSLSKQKTAKKKSNKLVDDWLDDLSLLGEEKAKEMKLAFNKKRIKGLLGKIKEVPLDKRMKSFIIENKTKSYMPLVKNPKDEEKIIEFACRMRHSEAHSGKNVLESIPYGYQLNEIARFMYLFDRDLIKQLVLDGSTS